MHYLADWVTSLKYLNGLGDVLKIPYHADWVTSLKYLTYKDLISPCTTSRTG